MTQETTSNGATSQRQGSDISLEESKMENKIKLVGHAETKVTEKELSRAKEDNHIFQIQETLQI